MERFRFIAAMLATVCACAAPAAAIPPAGPVTANVTLHVGAAAAPQGLLRVHETLAVPAGPLTLVYPQWIPGTHAPTGPIPQLTDIVVSADGRDLAWIRDAVNLYAYRVDVPAATRLDITYTFLGGAIPGYNTGRLATPNILSLDWSKVVLTPRADDMRTVVVTPSITLPSADWKYATALQTVSANAADVAFAPTSLDMLVDSPLDAGINARTWPLGTWHGVPVVLSAFADTPEELDASPETIAKFRSLVAEDEALYVNRHFAHYTFLLTLTDQMPGAGLEHHQSSDNGEGGDYLIKASALTAGADLLPHEFNHSWDGKYRRPYDLYTPNLNLPMVDDLLWVYEGMTQFYGELQAERAGLRTKQQWLDGLALTYARYDNEPGRLNDPLADTATASSIHRGYSAWLSERRGQDYYSEGELLWLEADALINKLSRGKKSLDDVARAFFGNGGDTGPEVVTFHRDDLVAALRAVQPYDWETFLETRVDKIAPHPPDPFTAGGYKLVYTGKPSDYEKLVLGERKAVDLWYSLGINARSDGTIVDVSTVSVAGKAGLSPADKIVAFNGRVFAGQDQVDDALRAAEKGPPLQVLVLGGGVYRTVTLDYAGGPRYPHLERATGAPDILGAIAKPLAAATK